MRAQWDGSSLDMVVKTIAVGYHLRGSVYQPPARLVNTIVLRILMDFNRSEMCEFADSFDLSPSAPVRELEEKTHEHCKAMWRSIADAMIFGEAKVHPYQSVAHAPQSGEAAHADH